MMVLISYILTAVFVLTFVILGYLYLRIEWISSIRLSVFEDGQDPDKILPSMDDMLKKHFAVWDVEKMKDIKSR